MTWAALALAAFVLAGSLVGHPGITSGPPVWGLLAGGLGALGAGLGLMRKPGLSRAQALVLGLLALFVGWSGLAGWPSLDPFLSGVTLSCYGTALGFLSLLLLTRDRRAGAHLLIVAALSCTFYGLLTAPSTRFKAHFTNPDCFSVLALTGCLLALGLLGRARGAQLYYLVAALASLGLTCLLTGARSGLLGLLFGLMVYAATAGGRRRSRLMLALLLPIGLALAFFGTVATQRWQNLLSGQDRLNVSSRLTVLRYGLETAAREKPLLGTGPGTFALAYQSHAPQQQAADYMNVAHNDYLQILVESGLVGWLLWCAFLGAGWRVARVAGSDAAGAVAASAGVAVYALANFAIPVLPTLLFWVGAVGVGVPVSGRPAPRMVSLGLGLFVLAAGVGTTTQGVGLLRADQALARASAQAKQLQWESALAELPSTSDPRIALARADYLERLGVFSDDSATLESAAQELRRAQTRSPRDVLVMLRLAGILQAQGRYPEAGAVLAEAVRQTPHSQRVRLDVARNLILQGRLEEATRELMQVSALADPIVVGELLALLERQASGKGLSLLSMLPLAQRAPVALRAAQTLRELNENEAATAFLKQAPGDLAAGLLRLELEPTRARKLTLLDELLGQAGLTPDEQAQLQARWATLQLEEHRSDLVVARLTSVAHDATLRLLLSQAYEEQGQLGNALQVLNDGAEEDPDGRVRVRLAQLCERAGNVDSAVDYLESVRREQPDNAGIEAELKRLRYKSGLDSR